MLPPKKEERKKGNIRVLNMEKSPGKKPKGVHKTSCVAEKTLLLMEK
jgi:hypothetical protein